MALLRRAPVTARRDPPRLVTSGAADARLRRKLGNASGLIRRSLGVLGVPRDKTIKPILVRRMQHLLRRRHRSLLLRGALQPAPPRAPFVHIAKPVKRRMRSKHRVLIFRGRFVPTVARIQVSIVRSRRTRMLLGKHSPLILRAPTTPTAFVTAETLKHIYLRSIARLGRTRARLTRNQALVLRDPGAVGVPRAKTIKGIYLHGVGRSVQLARKRRHRALLLRGRLPVAIPFGRVFLGPVDRTVAGKRRPRRFVLILRSRGGTAGAGVTQKTVKAIYVHSTSVLRRRRRVVLQRAPLAPTPRAGRIILHPLRRSSSGKLRRHRPLLLRGRFEVVRKTIKPILLRRARARLVGRHDPQILRAPVRVGLRRHRPIVVRARPSRRRRLWRHKPLILRSRGGVAAGTVFRKACVAIAVRALSLIGIAVRPLSDVEMAPRERVHVAMDQRAAADADVGSRPAAQTDVESIDCD